ncbi:hypothetical protein MW887_001500 [Aspergillus wentii]|nr:hypothetical protein MW887_001500 [Aspergillus wentii]
MIEKVSDSTSQDVKNAEEEAFNQVNALCLSDLGAKVRNHPSMDMTDLLKHQLKTYPTLRKCLVIQPCNIRDGFRIPTDVKIERPFSATVMRAAQKVSSDDASTVIGALNELVASSDIIWHLGSTAVLGLNSELVLKVGSAFDVSHIPTLDYIKQQAPNVPIPEIHGILQQPGSQRIFLFMSRVPGESLDSKWQSLGKDQKASIREQLDAIVKDFRSIPAPPAEEPQAVFGGGCPRRCKDARRQVRVAEGPIGNENDFNHFLASNPQRMETGNIAMIRSYLGVNHKLAMMTGGPTCPSISA